MLELEGDIWEARNASAGVVAALGQLERGLLLPLPWWCPQHGGVGVPSALILSLGDFCLEKQKTGRGKVSV